MFLYNSVCEYGEAEYVIQKSRFIAHAVPVESYEEAKEFVADIKEPTPPAPPAPDMGGMY